MASHDAGTDPGWVGEDSGVAARRPSSVASCDMGRAPVHRPALAVAPFSMAGVICCDLVTLLASTLGRCFMASATLLPTLL